MAVIGLFCALDEPRRDLGRGIEDLGHRVIPAVTMREAVDLLGAERPRAMVILCGPADRLAETFLGEVERVQPLTPVVVALRQRDATRAVELLKAGACEVLAPPYTRESLSATLSKALRFQGTAFEAVLPSEAARRAWWYAAAIAAFMLAAGSAVLVNRSRESAAAKVAAKLVPAVSEWDLPYSHPAGMAFRDGELWVGDWHGQEIYRVDPGRVTVRRAVHVPGVAPAAIALTGDAMLSVDGGGVLRRHMLDERLTVVARVELGLERVVGLAYDGLYLWSATASGKLRKHLMDDSLTVLSSYDYPGSKPAALAFDGRSLWSIDEGNRELLRHDINEPRLVLDKAALREYQSGEWRPAGLAWDGSAFWSAAENSILAGRRPGRLFKHQVPARAP